MKRPLFLLLIGLVLGELCGYWLYLTGVVIWASLLCLVLLCRRTGRKGKLFFAHGETGGLQYYLLLAFLSMGILGTLSWYVESEKIAAAKAFADRTNGKKYTLEGVVTNRKVTEKGYLSLTIHNPKILGEEGIFRLRGKCLCGGKTDFSQENIPMPGDRVSLNLGLSFPQDARNPGAFPERAYDLANGIYLKGEDLKILAVRRPSLSLRRYAYRVKCGMEEGYKRYLNPRDSGILCAMALGDKSDLDYSQRKLYEENGVLHLLAVSGLHISSVGGRIYRTLRRKGFSYGFSCLCGGGLLLFYGCMTGFGTSVLRACAMYIIFLASEYLGRPYDLTSAMSLTGIFMVLEHPWRVLDPGFQISFAAVAAIGLVFPFTRACLKMEDTGKKNGEGWNIWGKAGERILGSLVIFCVTTPLAMRTYYECSPYSILLNPLILPSMGILMISALLSGILGLCSAAGSGMPARLWGHPAFRFLWRILALPSVLILHGFRELFARVRSWKGALIITGCPSLAKVLLLYLYIGLILFLLSLYRKKGPNHRRIRRGMTVVFLIFWITVCLPADALSGRSACRITMLDVGQGESILVRLPGRKAMLMDGGSESREKIYEEVILPALTYYGISRLDYVLVSHMDEDHISGIRQMLASGYPVSCLITGAAGQDSIDPQEETIHKLCMKNHTHFLTMARGEEITLGEIPFLCLHPGKGTFYPDRNEKSLTMLVRWKDFSALFTGDLGSDQEETILEGMEGPVTLLKVGHHGSRYSTGDAFLDRLQPSYAIISAGRRNLYGHPHREVLERLHDHGTRIFQTKDQGAICLDTDGESLRIYYWTRRSRKRG